MNIISILVKNGEEILISFFIPLLFLADAGKSRRVENHSLSLFRLLLLIAYSCAHFLANLLKV